VRDASADRVTAAPPAIPARGRIVAEIVIVLGLSLGISALYSIVTLINRLTLEKSLAEQTATIAPSRDSREVFDFLYQLLGIASELVPVALVCFLLWRTTTPIGLAGLGVFVAGRALNLGVYIQVSDADPHWWTVPMMLLIAARAAIQEEVIMIGYLFARFGDLRWSRWTIILTSAAIRGTYHLYQGFGAFVANVAMGVVFGWLYTRGAERRVIPFVVAHFAIDAVVFVGAPAAAATWPDLFAPPG
jgi:membrane protease YdiL (CAAX protease family)